MPLLPGCSISDFSISAGFPRYDAVDLLPVCSKSLTGCPIGLVIAYGVNSAQNAMLKCTYILTDLRRAVPEQTGMIAYHSLYIRLLTPFVSSDPADEWKNDPRNVYAKAGAADKH